MRSDSITVESDGGRGDASDRGWRGALQAQVESTARSVQRQLDRAAYRAQQYAIMTPIAAARRLAALVSPTPAADRRAIMALQSRYERLLACDLENVEAGLYPRALLFQIPFGRYARAVPSLLRDAPRVVRRMLAGDHRDLPAEIDVERYPAYFRRNFHWQTDGYLSRRSAELYDLSVELLFAGTSDIMRRQVIPPISRYVAGGRDLRLLDVACGTGRTLSQIAVAHPRLRLYGVDLSPYYLQVARRVLADIPDVSLVAENAEALPFHSGHFDIVTSVYLFHELPRAARRVVLAEMYRVLRPGGLLVLEDSAQLAESGELAFFLGRFAADFHEPFYRDYVNDDLAVPLAQVGFRVESVEPHFVSKVFVARKVAGARGPVAMHRRSGRTRAGAPPMVD